MPRVRMKAAMGGKEEVLRQNRGLLVVLALSFYLIVTN